MSKLDKESVLEAFTVAYTKANGKSPTIEAKGGWYSINGGKNMRLAQLEEATSEFATNSSATKSAATSLKRTPAKPKKKLIIKSGFSVKDFYTQQILAINAGVKAPR